MLSLAALLLTLGVAAQTWRVVKTDGTLVDYPASDVRYVTILTGDSPNPNPNPNPDPNPNPNPNPGNHEYVDLGLPSGTQWATCNIGATKPEEGGDFFAWGETTGYNSGKTVFNSDTYKWWKSAYNSLTKYCVDSELGYNELADMKTELDLADDAAYMNWGRQWRMPTLAQVQELVNSEYTTQEWTTQNGVYGRKITSKANGKSIFLPAAGYHNFTSYHNDGTGGYYWSNTLYVRDSYLAQGLAFDAKGIGTYGSSRYVGRNIRPVCVPQ